MPDAFLRKVMHQRFLEQEFELVDTPPEVFGQQRCRLCGERCSMASEGFTTLTVCTPCGGRKKQVQLEREDEARKRKQLVGGLLLRLVGITNTNEETMSDRTCTKCGINKLRSTNTTGLCVTCKSGGEAPPASGLARSRKGSLKRFKAVTAALGVDGDELLADFCEAYMKRLSDAAASAAA